MAMRRVIFRTADGMEIDRAVLGFDFTICAAIRKFTLDDGTLLRIKLETDQGQKGIHEIGHELVDKHLKSKMKIFINDRDTGISMEFI